GRGARRGGAGAAHVRGEQRAPEAGDRAGAAGALTLQRRASAHTALLAGSFEDDAFASAVVSTPVQANAFASSVVSTPVQANAFASSVDYTPVKANAFASSLVST